MHERPYSEEIVRAVTAALRDHPGHRPERVRVRVGEIYHLVPESIRTHFEQMTRDTALAGTALDLVEVPLRVSCRDCGAEGGVEDHHLPACRACGSASVRVLEGNQIIVESISLTVPDAPAPSDRPAE